MVEQGEVEIRALLAAGAWLSTGQVAALFHVDPATIHRWAKAGRLRYRKPGGERGLRQFHPGDVQLRLDEAAKILGGPQPEAEPTP